jgi:hypothetical protein
MMRKYVAEFRVEGGVQEVNAEASTSDAIVSKERTFPSKTVGKVLTTGVGLGMTTSRIYQQHVAASNSIVGDAVAQRQFDNRMAYLNEGLSVFGSIGIAAIVNPALVGVAVLGLGVSYSMRAYQLSQETRVREASWQVERVVNQQKQNRLVKDITGIRV